MPQPNVNRPQQGLPLFTGGEWWETITHRELARWSEGVDPLPSQDWHAERLPSDPPCAWNEWRSHERRRVTLIRVMQDAHLQHAWRLCCTRRSHVSRLAVVWTEMMRRGMTPPRYAADATETIFVPRVEPPPSPPRPVQQAGVDDGPPGIVEAHELEDTGEPVERQPSPRARRARRIPSALQRQAEVDALSSLDALARTMIDARIDDFPSGTAFRIEQIITNDVLRITARPPSGTREYLRDISLPIPANLPAAALIDEELRALAQQVRGDAAPTPVPAEVGPSNRTRRGFHSAFDEALRNLPADYTASLVFNEATRAFSIVLTFPASPGTWRTLTRVISLRDLSQTHSPGPHTIVADMILEARLAQRRARVIAPNPPLQREAQPPPVPPALQAEPEDPWAAVDDDLLASFFDRITRNHARRE